MAAQNKFFNQMLSQVIPQNAFEKSLAARVPYIGVVDNIFYMETGRAGICFMITPIYDERISEADYYELKRGLNNLVNQFDRELIVQFKLVKNGYYEDLVQNHLKQNKSSNPLVKEVFNKRIEKIYRDIDEYKVFRYSYYVTISKKIDLFNIAPLKSFLQNSESISEFWHNQLLKIHQDMVQLSDKFEINLKVSGLEVKKPTQQETIDYIASSINLVNTHIDIETHEFVYPESFLESNLDIYWEYFVINGKCARIISIKRTNPPKDLVTFSHIKTLYNEDINFDIELMVTFQKQDMEAVERALSLKQNVAYSMKHGIGGKKIPKFEVQEENLTNLLYEYATGLTAAFDFELLIMVKADNPEDLRQNCEAIMTKMTKIGGMKGYRESSANVELYQKFWPGNNELLNGRNLPDFKTDNVTDFLPVFGPPKSSKEPVAIFHNSWSGLTYFNPLSHEYPNKNGLVIGATGQGKSFLMILLILNYLGIDPDLIFVERGDSYEKLVKSFGGQYFNITSDVSINPFLIDADEKRLFWISMIEIMLRDVGKEMLNTDEKIIIDDTIEKVEEYCRRNQTIVTIEDFISCMSELRYDNQVQKEIHDRLLRHLKRWTKGALGKFVNNKESSLDVSNRVLGFNLKGLESSELQEVFMNYISNIIWGKLNKEPQKMKIIVFDEVWSFFKSPSGIELIKGLYRTIRKYHGALITISQDIGSYAENEELKNAIMSNVGFYYILKQAETGDYEQLQNVFHVTNTEIEMIKSLLSRKGFYSESYIKTPEQPGFVGRLVPHPFLYWLATTDPIDKNAFDQELAYQESILPKDKMTKEEFQVTSLINTINVLAEKYPHGAYQ